MGGAVVPKKTVVTGAGRGIGMAVAEVLEGEGHEVFRLDLEPGPGIWECDVADPAAVERAADAIGPVDVLVNNAGIWRFAPLEQVDPAEFKSVLDVNLRGTFHCTRYFGAAMLGKGGVIINVASIAASVVGSGAGAYSASKAGVVALTKQTAISWGPRGVRCNAVAPGLIATPGTADIYDDPARRAARAAAVPSRRIGTPGDVAGLIAFLASDAASYINGQTIYVDGGLSEALLELLPRPPELEG
ncbi:MAG: SDR family oxidoreductase [Acidimicrobiia bacterium]|nr:SDR family oxidoreductase [Acidimicrobiia bacterium]